MKMVSFETSSFLRLRFRFSNSIL